MASMTKVIAMMVNNDGSGRGDEDEEEDEDDSGN